MPLTSDTNIAHERQQRYLQVRTAFILQGTSLHAWCKANSVAMPNVNAAFTGKWQGKKADALIKKVMRSAFAKDAA